jgi:hypothetical protein
MKKALVIVLFGLIIFLSCSKGQWWKRGGGGGGSTVNCATVTNKAFNADVLPIITSSCAINTTCHATGSTNGPGALTNWAQVSGNAGAIKTAVQSGRMPQTGSLTTGQKNSITCWVDNGALNN